FALFRTSSTHTPLSSLSLHDALPILALLVGQVPVQRLPHDVRAPALFDPGLPVELLGKLVGQAQADGRHGYFRCRASCNTDCMRSEEHTSELQSRENLVCRVLLEKEK